MSEQEATEKDQASRFRGAVLGAAIGDALAFPYQHYSRSFLRSISSPLTAEFVDPPSSFHPRGQYGPATQLMLATLASVNEAGDVSGESMANHMLPLWRDNLFVRSEESTAEAMGRLAKGQAEWHESGHESGRAEAAPLARAVVIGLWDHGEMDRIPQDVETVVRVTHRDPRALACGAMVAAAVASNVQSSQLHLGEFLDRVAAAASSFDTALHDAILDLPRILSQTEARALRYLESFCSDSRYPHTEDGLGEYCIPTAMTAIYYFLRAPYQFEKALDSCLRLGGHIDSVTFLAGALSGALVGDAGLPQSLIEGLLNSREITAAAEQLHESWWKQ